MKLTDFPELQPILDHLLTLPPEARLELGDCLLASVASDDVDAAWDEEIGRRIAEHEAGRGKCYPAAEVIAELRTIIDASK